MKHLLSPKLAPAAFAIAAAFALPAAHADVVNGGFHDGLAGWSTDGDASVLASNVVDPDRLWLTTASTGFADDVDFGFPAAGARNASGVAAVDNGTGALEAFTGAAPGAFGSAFEGSAATQTFTAGAGQKLNFRWDLGTVDTSGNAALADTAFVVIDGRVTTLGSILGANQPGTDGNAASTGWASFSATLATAGLHTVSFGVLDVGDYNGTSTLAIADVSVVPEAPSFALFAAGLGLLSVSLRRRRD
jgi:hypothetical protein